MATKSSSYKEKQCEHCGHSFAPSGARSQFCSDDCRREARLRRDVAGRGRENLVGRRFGRLIVDQPSTRRGPDRRRPGSTYVSYESYWLCVCNCGNVKRVGSGGLKSGRIRSCGCLHSETSRATGSRRGADRGAGWRGGLNQNGYSNTWIDGKNVLVHRVVMEQMLGRPLLPEETVHHINGIRHDNRPENLELWSGRQPRGQRVEDKVEWAVELLKLYAPDRLA